MSKLLIPISCKTKTLKILSHALLILAKSIVHLSSSKSIAPTQVNLNIPQLLLGELAQLDRHRTVNTKV